MILEDQTPLAELDAQVRQALRSGDESSLDVMGYGEISLVLGLSTREGRFACKRLPPFRDQAQFDGYATAFGDYLEALRRGGVHVPASELVSIASPEGGFAVYVVQRVLDPEGLLPRVFRREPQRIGEWVGRIADLVERAVSPQVGIDGQISNWALDPTSPSGLAFLDVTTPLLRDADGRERLDVGIFLASLPWALRPIVRRFMLRSILDKYYVPRGVLLDLLGNLEKERVAGAIPELLADVGSRFSPAITADEVKKYYADDASTWALLLRLRRMDRGWQHLWGRTYPFLLPRDIER